MISILHRRPLCLPEHSRRRDANLLLAAEAAGRPGATRAAGQAMARNPVPLLVPCHRVIGSNGRLHGFGGGIGLPLKARLLELEACLNTTDGVQLTLRA